MHNDIVIRAEGISKKFCRSLKHVMLYGVQDIAKNTLGMSSNSEMLREGEFWAVNDISFEVKKGEVFGIIGANGSGKSTLLKLLNGIFMPDKGKIEINGRVGALIEVGAGFHPMLTGRENIYVNGSILGMSKKEINKKFDEIVEFAGIGDFLDSPVKHYSSGMYVRLGFAVAVHCDPDILIVDEVLAVGDFKFRQKCAAKINELKQKVSVILVSHSMRDVLMMCSHAVVLDKGRTVCQGAAEEAVDFYMDMMEAGEEAKKKERQAEAESKRALSNLYGDFFHNTEKITDVQARWVDESGKPVDSIEHGSTIALEFSFRLPKPAKELIIGIPIWDSKGNMITGISSDMSMEKIQVHNKGFVKGKLIMDNLILNQGAYKSVLAIQDAREYLYRNLLPPFDVKNMPVCFGCVTPPYRWVFEQGDGF